jgi:dihydroflavonol-4-reductase
LLSLKGADPEIFKGNFTIQSDLNKAFSGCSAVVHAAANTSQWAASYEEYKSINIDGTQILLEESKKAGIERFIYVGSANAFGPGTKLKPGDETSSFTLHQEKSGYMISKHEAQEHVLNFHHRHNFPAVIVNPTFMLGKFDSKPSSGQMLLMGYGKKIMFYPVGGKNFVHVEDVASGIINAIERGKNGECYLLANENLSYDEFFSRMKKVTGYPKRKIQLPGTMLSIAGEISTYYEMITKRPAKLNRINARLLSTENYYSPAKAIDELQLLQTPIDIAIKDALEWFDENGYLK